MSTERLALLTAIRDNPEDRLALEVYADWLDENSHLPAATATAELIRLACSVPSRNWATCPPWCRDWIEAKWQSLIPSVMEINYLITEPSDMWVTVPKGGIYSSFDGQYLSTFITLPARPVAYRGMKVKMYSCRLGLVFGFGMVWHSQMGSAFGRERVWPALEIDQPQLFLPPPEEKS